jgi:hypothetical protein
MVYATNMNKLLSFKTADVTATSEGVTRTETIDLRKNKLFAKCKTIGDIEGTYEAYWDIGSGPRVTVIAVKLN